MASIYKRNKTWWMKFRNPLTGKIVCKSLKTGDKKMAKDAKSDLEARLLHGHLGFGYQRSFQPFLDEYKAYMRNHLRPLSVKRYEEHCATFVRFLESVNLENAVLEKIAPQVIEAYKAHRLKKVKPITVNADLDFLGTLFARAVEWGYLQKSPIKRVKRFVVRQSRPRWLTKDELAALVRAAPDWLKPHILILAYTGLRRGELAELKWTDIKKSVLTVRLEGTKGRHERSVPLSKKAVAVCGKLSHESEYVFPRLQDYWFRRNGLRKYIQSAAKRAGIADVTTHTLRHTFASHLAQQGVSLYIIAKLLGHRDPSRTTTLYAHLAPDNLHDVVEKLPY